MPLVERLRSCLPDLDQANPPRLNRRPANQPSVRPGFQCQIADVDLPHVDPTPATHSHEEQGFAYVVSVSEKDALLLGYARPTASDTNSIPGHQFPVEPVRLNGL